METEYQQQVQQESDRRGGSKRHASKGKQSIDKPLVPCQIRRIERIGVTKRGNTPYIVYYTPYGKCCTFVSRQYFWQSLFNLCGLKRLYVEKISGYGIRPWSVSVLDGDNRYNIPIAEVGGFLSRQNQMVLDGLQVKIVGNRVWVWNPVTGQMREVIAEGCTCEDKLYNPFCCKHRIAAHRHLRKLGWGSLQDFFERDETGVASQEMAAIAF